MKRLKLIALLSLVALTSIMLVGCGRNGGNGMPELDSEVALTIRKDLVINDIIPSVEYASIRKYFGTFDDAVVVAFTFDMVFAPGHIVEVDIAGFVFMQPTNWLLGIIVWYDGDLSSLCQAYADGLLTRANISVIHQIHRGGN